MVSCSFRWLHKLFRSHRVKEFDRRMMDTSEDDETEINPFSGIRKYDVFPRVRGEELDCRMTDTSEENETEINYSSSSKKYDVFPSFSGEDVRKAFLSHLLKALEGRSINTFIDHGIERSRPIGPELLSAIRESNISIVIFSKNYASSTWCLNELVEIHKCFTDLGQKIIPVFYHVDPSDVRKQTGDFGKVFEVTCKGKTEDQKQSWLQALADIANMAGEDLQNWPDEAHLVEKIATDVLSKLISPSSSSSSGEFVGIEAHLEAMKSILCLESMEARMVGIWGTSGIGKSTVGRALFSHLSRQFPFRNFVTYTNSTDHDVCSMKANWEQKFLSEILGQKDIKIEHFGVVEKRFKDKKVLIVLDDVDSLEFLKTLVGEIKWFGPGSRIIVITQDRRLLEAHDINLLYEVKFPSQDLALQMFCRSAFGENSPPDDFKELAVEVTKLAGNLPLGLSVLGSSLKRKAKQEWIELLLDLQNGLDGNIMKTLRVSYDRLIKKDQELFHYIAGLFNGRSVKFINYFLGDVNIGLKRLVDKSLIRKTPDEKVEMHNLLEKLATEIDRAESQGNPGNRRFLKNDEDVLEVFIDKTGTKTILGIFFDTSSPSQIKKPFISIDEKSFEGMLNLQFLQIRDHYKLHLPNGLVYLPRKLKWLEWNNCPLKCLPSNFKAECLIELRMKNSKLEKLWEGTDHLLGSLVEMDLSDCGSLREIPDLSKATNLEKLILSNCKSLVMLPSTIGNLQKLVKLEMRECAGLEVLPVDINLSSLQFLDLRGCSSLRSFPLISNSIETLNLGDTAIEQVPCCVENLSRLTALKMYDCKKLKNISPNIFRLKSLKQVDFTNCGGVFTALSDVTVMATMDVHYENTEKGKRVDKTRTRDEDEYYHWYGRNYFNFQNCFKIDGDARELILRSCFKSTMVLPGGKMPTCFEHRAYGNSLTVTLPQSYLSQEFLRFNACVVVEPLSHLYASMRVGFHLNGEHYMHTVAEGISLMCTTDHLVLCSFKIRPIGLPSELDFNDVQFDFSYLERIKECGIRLLNVSPYPDDGDGRSETESFCLEGEALCVNSMITAQQDAQIPIAEASWSSDLTYRFGDFVGIEAHIEAMKSILCLESKEARMVGIWGTSGIGKTTIGRALFSHLSRQFPFCNFVTFRKSTNQDVSGTKSKWEQKFLSKILGEKDIKIEHFGAVEKRLKDKKVLIVLDNVDNLEFLKTLVGKTEWFGPGSRIIVITQDRRLLKAHEIDLLYEVKFPSQDLALKMFCKSAFRNDSPPDGFKELAVEVVMLAGNLPLGLSVLGSSLERRMKKLWMELLPELQYGLDGNIMKTLGFSYDRLSEIEQYLFHYIAGLFNGESYRTITDFLGPVFTGLHMLVNKSLIHITLDGKVEMHKFLVKLSTEIDRAESQDIPGKRRFLKNNEEILDVFTNKTGTGTVLGIDFNVSSLSQVKNPFISIDEKTFEGMRNLQFLRIHCHSTSSESPLRLPRGLVYLPRKLKWLEWSNCPLKCLPSNFKAKYLIKLIMQNSKLEKLWEETQFQSLGSLVKLDLSGCANLREIPDLSKATNLEKLILSNCKSLVMLPSTIGNLQNLRKLEMRECTGLEVLPVVVNLPYLQFLDLRGCSSLRSFPLISNFIETLNLGDTAIEQVPCCVENLSRLTELKMYGCKKLKNISPNIFRLKSLKKVDFTDCGGVITALSEATVVARIVKKINGENENEEVDEDEDKDKDEDGKYFNFQNCINLDGDVRELILRSCLRWTMVLPGGEVPTFFEHRAYGNSLTVTLPQSSLSQEFLRFNACFLIEPLTDYAFMSIGFHFNGESYSHTVGRSMPLMCKTDHLVLCSFKFRPLGLKLDFNDVEFKFSGLKRIKECGIRLLNVSPYPGGIRVVKPKKTV